MVKVFYNSNYVASGYSFDTTRKSEHISDSLLLRPINGVKIVDPQDDFGTAIDIIDSVHDPKYVQAVWDGRPKNLSESNGFPWDDKIFTMAMSHSAGLIAATREAIANRTTAGSLSSGLHHASVREGGGFCTFNGLAASAHYAESLGAEKVLILDYDAHAGGGTWNILKTMLPNTVQVDVTVSAFDTYTPQGKSRLDIVKSSEYSKAIRESLGYAATLGQLDLIIYNAGMDPLNSGVSLNDVAEREDAVREFIGDPPAIFALAGGYTWGDTTMEELVDWHRMTLNAWAS